MNLKEKMKEYNEREKDVTDLRKEEEQEYRLKEEFSVRRICSTQTVIYWNWKWPFASRED